MRGVVDAAVAETGRLDVFFANAGVGGNLLDLRDVAGESFYEHDEGKCAECVFGY